MGKNDDYEGIKCPNPQCGVVGKVKCGQLKKEQDCLRRPKTCANCGTKYVTVEVPVCTVSISNDHLPAPETPVVPVVPVVPLVPAV